ncbi:hypothetical protein THZB04_310004 [Vibrio owensii]|nr:hypothetical protein THZB04_310004 [Vibrio owensii]
MSYTKFFKEAERVVFALTIATDNFKKLTLRSEYVFELLTNFLSEDLVDLS